MSKDFNQGPLIEPMERPTYPDGIPEEQKESVLKREKEMLEGSYVTSPFEKMEYNLRIQLSISSGGRDEVVIDFTNYPERPWIILDDKLQFELGKNLTEVSFFLKKWDSTQPPHIIEIVKEIEALLMKARLSGKFTTPTETIKQPEAPKFDPKAVLIVDKRTKMLIFLQKLTIKAPVDKQELSQVIKTINAEIGNFEINAFNKIRMKNDLIYFFVNFERLIVIMLCKGEAPPPFELLNKINGTFMDKYSDFLEDYSKSDVIAFKDFSQNIKKYLETYLYEEPDKDLEIQITELLEDEEPSKPKPQLKPMKPPESKLKPMKPPEPKVKPELIKTVEFKTVVPEPESKWVPKPNPEILGFDEVPDIFKPPSLRSKPETVEFPKIMRDEIPSVEKEPAEKIDIKPMIFDSKANDIDKVKGYALNFTDYNEFFSLAMEHWGVPKLDPDKLLNIEKIIKKKLKSSSLMRALFISSNPADPSIYKLWLKTGKIKKNEVRKSLKQDYLFFVESNINEKLTHLCWTQDNNEFIILREINDDPLHLEVLFNTTNRVTDWNFK